MATPSSPRFVALTGLVALLAGAMLLLARLLRLGFLADFLSRTVLVGFLTGVGIQVAAGEIHGMLGLEKGPHGFFAQLWYVADHINQASGRDIMIAAIVLAIIVGCERLLPRFPGALVAVIGMIIASASLHWPAHGIKVVGAVPGGLPPLRLPAVAWDDILPLLGMSFSCFIVILAQSAATSRVYALRYRDQFSENVDLVGLSLANIAAGFCGSFVVNGSPTKTAMVDSAGGRSQVSQLATCATVALVLLFLTGPLSDLPEAVLAAIVFLIGIRLIDIRGLRDIRAHKPHEFVLALVTAATVVFLGVEHGILLALVLSLMQHVRRSYQPHSAVILNDPHEHWRMEPVAPGKMIEPGIVAYWYGADLFYANAAHFAEQALTLVLDSPSPVRWLILDAGAMTDIDYTAAGMLRDLHDDLAKHGIGLAVARVSNAFRQDLDDLGLTALIGPHLLFASRRDCIAACRAAIPPQPRQD
jgi:MFS superfamily sulfate permease-like transporter